MSSFAPTEQKHLVIGAGPVGLAMADALTKAGVPFDHIEAKADLGGNWFHGVFKNTHTISSKRSTAYADYPMPESYPDFPSGGLILGYLRAYARDRGLTDRIEMDTKVDKASPRPDGLWLVRLQSGQERIYKGLVICTGHHWDRRWPKYPGAFSGEMVHSKDYYDSEVLKDRRVLVIGGGNSAVDIVCDGARTAASCDLSLRSGYWYMPKMVAGIPTTELPIGKLPVVLQRLLLRAIIALTIGDYRKYGLQKPDHKIFDRHPAFGTEMLGYIRQGRIKPRPGIDRWDGKTVFFTDGSSGEYDLIVAATGFYNSLPFLPDGMITVKNDVVQIYGGAFPAHVRNIYIVGSAQLRGGFGPVLTPLAQLYARLIVEQQSLDQPIGRLLRSLKWPLPTTNLVDPVATRRRIRQAYALLPMLKRQDQRLKGRRRSADDAVAHG